MPNIRGAGVYGTIVLGSVTSHVENPKSRRMLSRAEKQQQGVCVRKACYRDATDGDFCSGHAKQQRSYHAAFMKRSRATWEAENRCTNCGAKDRQGEYK